MNIVVPIAERVSWFERFLIWLENGAFLPKHTIQIEVKSGAIIGVAGLPAGWKYEVVSYDKPIRPDR